MNVIKSVICDGHENRISQKILLITVSPNGEEIWYKLSKRYRKIDSTHWVVTHEKLHKVRFGNKLETRLKNNVYAAMLLSAKAMLNNVI